MIFANLKQETVGPRRVILRRLQGLMSWWAFYEKEKSKNFLLGSAQFLEYSFIYPNLWGLYDDKFITNVTPMMTFRGCIIVCHCVSSTAPKKGGFHPSADARSMGSPWAEIPATTRTRGEDHSIDQWHSGLWGWNLLTHTHTYIYINTYII